MKSSVNRYIAPSFYDTFTDKRNFMRMGMRNSMKEILKDKDRIIELSQQMRHFLYEDGSTTLKSEVTFISSYISLMKKYGT